MVQSGIPAPMLHQPKRHAWLQLLNKKPSAWASEGGGSISDVEATMQDMQNKHVQEIVKMAHDLNIQHAKAMEVQRKEVEAKDMRIENIVATLSKVLNEREFLKNELQRAGHQNVLMKMKHVAAGERDMLKSIKDQITGKKSAAVEDRGMQTMDVQFADDKDSDSDEEVGAASGGGDIRAAPKVSTIKAGVSGVAKGLLAETLKNIYEADTKSGGKGKKKAAKGGQDWTFMDLDTFKKELVKQGTTFDAVVADIKLPKEWQRSLKVGPKVVMAAAAVFQFIL